MKNILRYLWTIILLISFSSCDILDSNGDSISPLNSKINFKIIESYDDYESVSIPYTFIEMQTEKIYGCYNYRIITNHIVKDKVIEIDVIGIDKSGVCATALGPANGRIKLGRLSGIFEIKFNHKNFIDNYNLLISDSLIILDGKGTSNTKPLLNFAYRYPENSFAYLCGTTLSDTAVCSDFIDTLKSVINLTEFNFSDIAEIPYPTSSQGHQYDADARYFYYESESEFNKIEEIMRKYKQNHSLDDGGIGITVINWMNKKIRSWLL